MRTEKYASHNAQPERNRSNISGEKPSGWRRCSQRFAFTRTSSPDRFGDEQAMQATSIGAPHPLSPQSVYPAHSKQISAVPERPAAALNAGDALTKASNSSDASTEVHQWLPLASARSSASGA